MFTYSEAFWIAVALAAFFVLCAAAFYSTLKRSVGWTLGLAVVICLGLSALVSQLTVGVPYFIFYPLVVMFSAIPLAAVIVALLWAAVLRWGPVRQRFARFGTVPLVLAIMVPALIGVGIAYERQRLPELACAHSHIPVQLGQLQVQLPLILHADVFVSDPVRSLGYRPKPRYREDVKKLCKLTRGGQTPVQSEMIWLASMSFMKALDARCAEEDDALCQGYSPERQAQIGAVRVMRKTETALRYELDLLNATPKPGERRAGNAQSGHVCQTRSTLGGTHHCRMWRTLAPDVVILMTSDHVQETNFEDLLSVMEAEMTYMLRILAVRGT